MRTDLPPPHHRIAYFITPHGFGHAARACAVMAALQELDTAIRCEIFTQVPQWFFQDSLPGSFGYHPLLTDIGLVQHTALLADLPATLQRLDDFLPFAPATIADLARQLQRLACTPHRTGFFHPDLVHACDAVVGKVGYSTVAEVNHAGMPFGYIARQDFRESPVLAAYIAQHMPSLAIAATQFHRGDWLAHLSELLALPQRHHSGPNGATQVARFVYRLLDSVEARHADRPPAF